jgi:hypothetical protein
MWFFATVRDEGSHRTVPGMFANLNAGDPTKWTYLKDTTRPAAAAQSFRPISLRLTVQANARNKFGLFWDEQLPCEGAAFQGAPDSVQACRRSGPNEIIAGGASPTPSVSATAAPETGAYRDVGNKVRQATWQSPVTSRLLLEAGVGAYSSRWGGVLMPGSPAGDLVRITEQCAAGCANNGGISGLTYRSPNFSANWQGSVNWRATASYVVGAQSAKFGYQGGYLMDNRKDFSNPQYLTYRTNNGVPDQLTETINRFDVLQRVRYDAFFAQEAWTMGRLTLQGALRLDIASSIFPEAQIGGVRFLPNVTTFPETKGVDKYRDLTPRAGVAYDVFGNGKTAVKVSFGRYLEAAQNAGLFVVSRPTSRVSTTATRTWTDANGNWTPDCDLLSNASQNLIATGSDFCGSVANTNFGKSVFDTTQDPALFSGWGVRSGDWQIGASVQQQLLPRMSMEVGYYRRWLQNFIVTDNLTVSAANYDPFTISAPLDSRLPNGGGYQIPGPLYNINPSVASSATSNFVTLASNYGDQTQTSNSVSLNLSARPRNGLVFQGGFNTAETLSDYCGIRAVLPELTVLGGPSPTNPYCNTNTGWITRFTALGSYTFPKVDVQVAGTVRSDQGDTLSANWAAPNAVIAPSLGRSLSSNAPTATVNLIEPGTLYGDRVNEVDLRLAKILKVGRMRANVGFDIYNIFNRAAVLTYNQTFVLPTAASPNGSWLTPTSVLQPRFFKISAQLDF